MWLSLKLFVFLTFVCVHLYFFSYNLFGVFQYLCLVFIHLTLSVTTFGVYLYISVTLFGVHLYISVTMFSVHFHYSVTFYHGQ